MLPGAPTLDLPPVTAARETRLPRLIVLPLLMVDAWVVFLLLPPLMVDAGMVFLLATLPLLMVKAAMVFLLEGPPALLFDDVMVAAFIFLKKLYTIGWFIYPTIQA